MSRIKYKVAQLIALAGLVGFGTSTVQGINVTTTTSASTLAGSIQGSGITVVGTPTLAGGPVSAGTFIGGLSSGITIDKGIILTTGDAGLAPGPNNRDDATDI